MENMKNMKINVLGTEYKIETHKVSEDKYLEENSLAGYCGEESKLIVVADMSEEKYFDLSEEEQKSYRKKTLRHEIMHAFLMRAVYPIVQTSMVVHGRRMRKWWTGSPSSLRRFLKCIWNWELLMHRFQVFRHCNQALSQMNV